MGSPAKVSAGLPGGNTGGEGLEPWALRSLTPQQPRCHVLPPRHCPGPAGGHGCPCVSTEPEHELFLVYGKGRPGIIRGMDMGAKVPDEHMIPIENLMNPRALDFHAETGFIYFADTTSYLIGRQKIDGTERETILKDGAWPRGWVSVILIGSGQDRALFGAVASSFHLLTGDEPTLLFPQRHPQCGRDRRGLDGEQPVLDG